MAHYDWELTDEEKEKCARLGHSESEYQEAKKKAFIENGGVILNPNSLYDMYEALEYATQWLKNIMVHSAKANLIMADCQPKNSRGIWGLDRALNKASGKE